MRITHLLLSAFIAAQASASTRYVLRTEAVDVAFEDSMAAIEAALRDNNVETCGVESREFGIARPYPCVGGLTLPAFPAIFPRMPEQLRYEDYRFFLAVERIGIESLGWAPSNRVLDQSGTVQFDAEDVFDRYSAAAEAQTVLGCDERCLIVVKFLRSQDDEEANDEPRESPESGIALCSSSLDAPTFPEFCEPILFKVDQVIWFRVHARGSSRAGPFGPDLELYFVSNMKVSQAAVLKVLAATWSEGPESLEVAVSGQGLVAQTKGRRSIVFGSTWKEKVKIIVSVQTEEDRQHRLNVVGLATRVILWLNLRATLDEFTEPTEQQFSRYVESLQVEQSNALRTFCPKTAIVVGDTILACGIPPELALEAPKPDWY